MAPGNAALANRPAIENLTVRLLARPLLSTRNTHDRKLTPLPNFP
jgi:hypothetical protein